MIGFSDDDALAAEYALGTLDHDERLGATERRRIDRAFDAAVREWETRLAPLTEAVEDVQPPAGLLNVILGRLDLVQNFGPSSNVVQLRQRVRVWRGVAAAVSALAATLAIWIAYSATMTARPPAQRYVAVLQQGADTPAFVVSVDLQQRSMTVMPLAAKAPSDKSFELWMIGADHGTPKSLGLVDPDSAAHPSLQGTDRGVISNATYAVTLEPRGGSPTGQPTSAPVFVGKLLDVPN